MKIVTIDDAENVILGLQDEIRRSEEARYDHRLHGLLLVAYGMNCCQVADLLGDAPRTVAYWVERFEDQGESPLRFLTPSAVKFGVVVFSVVRNDDHAAPAVEAAALFGG
jgi:hypothetical protein